VPLFTSGGLGLGLLILVLVLVLRIWTSLAIARCTMNAENKKLITVRGTMNQVLGFSSVCLSHFVVGFRPPLSLQMHRLFAARDRFFIIIIRRSTGPSVRLSYQSILVDR